MTTGFSRIVRASLAPSISSWSHAATYQQFFRKIASLWAAIGCSLPHPSRARPAAMLARPRHSTRKVAFIVVWSVHRYGYVPAFLAVKRHDLPAAIDPESKAPAAVTVCGNGSLLVQTTTSPGR